MIGLLTTIQAELLTTSYHESTLSYTVWLVRLPPPLPPPSCLALNGHDQPSLTQWWYDTPAHNAWCPACHAALRLGSNHFGEAVEFTHANPLRYCIYVVHTRVHNEHVPDACRPLFWLFFVDLLTLRV